MKTALVLGAGGFIGSHIVDRLKKDGYWVRGVDISTNKFRESKSDEFLIYDLRIKNNVDAVVKLECSEKSEIILPFNYHSTPFAKKIAFDEIYQLAADMGGAGYINTGLHDADVMQNSATINLNVLDSAVENNVKTVFFSSSACVYNEDNQINEYDPDCREDSAYPALPDSEYGWEKLFSERLYLAYNRKYGMNNKIARFHNIYGEYGTWEGGKEKSPAAICRKIALCEDGGTIEIWGDGNQSRSFLYIDECVEAVMRLMKSEYNGPVNVGSEFLISINDFANLVAKISKKNIKIKNVVGPQGVRGRRSNNDLIFKKLNWKPSEDLEFGVSKLYNWIEGQINAK